MVNLSFAKQLWMLFHAPVFNGLASIKPQLGCSVDLVMGAIEEYIHHFFVQDLQLDPGFKSGGVSEVLYDFEFRNLN